MYTLIMAQECVCAHHTILMVIHVVRLSVLFFDSLFFALFLSVCLSYPLLFSSHFYLYSALNLFLHVDDAKANKHCAFAKWGVWHPGRIHPSHRFECFEQPVETKVWSEFCFIERQENGGTQQPKTQQHILKSGDKMTLNLRAPGNWCGVVNLQIQGTPGNWCEVMTVKSKGQGWNSTICKSQTIDTLKKSSRTCCKSWISQKRHQYSTWRSMYGSGNYSCRQRWKPLFIFDQITKKFWKCTGTQTSRNSRSRNSECTTDWLDSFLMDEIYADARSSNQVDASKSTRLLRFRLKHGETARAFRSESKIECSTRRIWTVQFLHRIFWNWWRTDWVRVGLASLEILEDPKRPAISKHLNLNFFWRTEHHVNVQSHRLGEERHHS